MTAPLNAIDAITAAFTRAGELLFRPFRWSFWWRMAFLAFITGEVSGSGNGIRVPAEILDRSGEHGNRLAAASPALPLAAIVVIVLAVAFFVVVFMYLACVFRFVLFDAVLTGRYRLRQGFDRWQAHGTRFFWWVLGYVAVMLVALAFCVLFIAGSVAGVKAGAVISILVLVFAALVAVCIAIAGAVVFVLTKDFVVPMMAMDGTGAVDAWARFRPMITANFVDYLAYLGMKIVLAMGAALITGIASLIILVVIGLPVGIVVALMVTALGLTWNPVTVLLAIVAGVLVFGLVFFLLGLLGAPFAVFFQAYAILFFGRRYRPLELVLYPEPPAPPAPAAPVAPPMPPPVEPGAAPA